MEYDFFNSIYYSVLCCTVIPLLIGAFAVLVFVIKKKYLKFLIIFLMLFFLCEETSYIFRVGGLVFYGDKKEEFCLKNSARFALIPVERGIRYAQLAERYAQSEYPNEAKKYYELARKYIGTYKNLDLAMAGYHYMYIFKDSDTAIKIFTEQEQWVALAECYILKDDYKTALSYALKNLERNPKTSYPYELLYAINKNLGNVEQAKENYEKAQQLCSSKVCKDRLSELTKDVKAYLERPRNYYTEYRIDGTKNQSI